jgi:hypothetical protein
MTTTEISDSLERVDNIVNILAEICDHMDGFSSAEEAWLPASPKRCALGAMSCTKQKAKATSAPRARSGARSWAKAKKKPRARRGYGDDNEEET